MFRIQWFFVRLIDGFSLRFFARWFVVLSYPLFVFLFKGIAQDYFEIINHENVSRLESNLTIDFDDFVGDAGEIVSGWLRVSSDGQWIVSINRDNDLLVWNAVTGDLSARYRITGNDGLNANMLDVAWSDDNLTIHSLHTDGTAYTIGAYNLASDELISTVIPVITGDMPVRVWADINPDMTWVEVIPTNPSTLPYVLQLSLVDGHIQQQLVSAPEADRDAVMRIGRMPAPLAVTSTLDGLAQLWNLETGDLLTAVQVDDMPMFGHINGAAGRKLAWRDPASENLNLLDFELAENRLIAALDGVYYQALLVVPDGSVILGVNVDQAPIVRGWVVETGDMLELGAYRTCGRTPDMIQMSVDGTALVIGCDTGLDIWRIED